MDLNAEEQSLLRHIAQAYFHQDFDLDWGGDLAAYWQQIRNDQNAFDAETLRRCFQRLLAQSNGAELERTWQRLGPDLLPTKAAEARGFFELAADAFKR